MNEQQLIITIVAFLVGAVLSKLSSHNKMLNKISTLLDEQKDTSTLADVNDTLTNQITDKEKRLLEKSNELEKLNERYRHIKNDAKRQKQIDKLKSLKLNMSKLKTNESRFSKSALISMYQELYRTHYDKELSLSEVNKYMNAFTNQDDDYDEEPAESKLEKKRRYVSNTMGK